MNTELTRAFASRIIPVVTIHDANQAVQLADALIAGGLRCAEITLRSNAAATAIARLVGYRDMVIGAGTVLDIDQARAAVDSGATFIITPGFNPKVVQYCLDHKIEIIPGTATPSDIEKAIGFGLEVVKFFPAESYGGVNTLKLMGGPYGTIRFIPTGGIGPSNLLNYLSLDNVIACGGSWMVRADLINTGHFDEITLLTKSAMKLVSQASL